MSVSLLDSRNEPVFPVFDRSESSLSARAAGLVLRQSEGDDFALWILRIFDGDTEDNDPKCLHEYYREVCSSQSAEERLVEADRTLRTYYGLGGWVMDSLPKRGFERSWTRKPY
jgi:hypothetical protein